MQDVRGSCLSRLSEPESHLAWPALSPGLSPIEHLWDELGRRVRRRQNPTETLQPIMTNSSPHHNTTASKAVGLIHTHIRKMFPTPAVHTITSIAKAK
jgi:hypothetical protein